MEIREVLEMLGPERVKKAMRSFSIEPERSFGGSAWKSCYLAMSAGDQGEVLEKLSPLIGKYDLTRSSPFGQLVEKVLGLPFEAARLIWQLFDGDRKDELYDESILFLAEHGSVPEPTPTIPSTIDSLA